MLGSFANQNLVRFASFAKTSFAKIFSSISDWQKYLLKMLHRHVLSSTFAILARVSPYLETNSQILASTLQICTLARCIPPLFFLKECLLHIGLSAHFCTLGAKLGVQIANLHTGRVYSTPLLFKKSACVLSLVLLH